MHPLTPVLSELSDDEVLSKINNLQQHLTFAYKMGQYGMIQQIQMVLEDYNIEHQNRQKKMMEDLQKRYDQLEKK